MKDLINSGIYIKNKALENSKEKTIIVLGMARSGTSMVARVLNGMDVFLGNKIDQAVFEDVEIAESLEKGDLVSFKNLIQERNKSHKIWGWKRPNSLNHTELITKSVRNPHFIIVYRDLLSIALRNHISMDANLDESLKLSNQTYQKINEFVAKTKAPIMLVSYEKAIHRKRKFIKELANFIDFKLKPSKVEQLFKLIETDRAVYLENSTVYKFVSSISNSGNSIVIKANHPHKPELNPIISVRFNDLEKSTKLIEVTKGEKTIDANEFLLHNSLNKVVARDNETKLHLNHSPLIFFNGEISKAKPVFVFTHIPKTAGTSFRVVMEKKFSIDEFFPNKEEIKKNKGQYPNFDSLRNEPIERIRKINFLAGHFTKFSTLKIPFNAKYLTFFRKPADRIISNLIHFKANDKRCVSLSLDEIFEQRKANISDLQIRYILRDLSQYSKLKSLNDAEFRIEISKSIMEYDFFGLKENLEDSILMFNSKYGFNIAPLKNQNPKKLNLEPSEQLIKKINDLIHQENILYEVAITIFNQRLKQLKS